MNILWFKDCSYKNKHVVGGKCSSLGELYNISNQLNFNIVNGFAITINLYDKFISHNNLLEKIKIKLDDIVDISQIDILNKTANQIKKMILSSKLTKEQEDEIYVYYDALKKQYTNDFKVAVRSSAIAEDLPYASFAGQQDTFLNINKTYLIEYIIACYASLFNARAISYRKTNNIDFSQVKMSVAIQKMVRSDLASAGVAFSIDPETGYNKAIVINSSYGFGELVVSGGVKPDEIIIDKRALLNNADHPIIDYKLGDKTTKIICAQHSTREIITTILEQNTMSINQNKSIELAKIVQRLEQHYKTIFGHHIAIDIEWAIDGFDNKIYILQSRPETVHSNRKNNKIEKFILDETSNILVTGVAVGEKITAGKIKCLTDISQHNLFNEGDILVTKITTPDWEPIMKKSNGIITDKGGRTSHAAIVSRELGINAIVGTINGSKLLKNNMMITMSCAEGEIGNIYDGILNFHKDFFTIDLTKKPKINLMLNVGSPENAFSSSMLPNSGVGLTRIEFIINNHIKIHPLALCNYPNVMPYIKEIIEKDMISYNINNPINLFVNKLALGIGKIASAFYPNPVIVRLSDFKSNEYKNLIGGKLYEPIEENPMIGWRGASRYYSKEYRKAFDLECQAIKFARENMQMDNIIVMIPFCRTPEECKKVIQIMSENKLVRGENNLKIFIMCEIPSNVIEADIFSQYVDGVSIGGNDLLQLIIGVDRDSASIVHLSNHENISYRRMIKQAIKSYKEHGIKVGFCGQQPSDSIEFAEFLMNSGIDSISVVPESMLKTYNTL